MMNKCIESSFYLLSFFISVSFIILIIYDYIFLHKFENLVILLMILPIIIIFNLGSLYCLILQLQK
jgi:hypothetical protein